MERDCWLSPYGEIFWCTGTWTHDMDAVDILIDNYGFEDEYDIDKKYPDLLPTDVLMDVYGWVRYSSCANRGWCFHKEPTTDQKNIMFDLTGFIYS